MRIKFLLFVCLSIVLAANLAACASIKAALLPPTQTATPTITPKPSATATVTPTSTPTSTPTITPTPTATPLPDLSLVLLTLNDLPGNFIEISPSEVEGLGQGMEGFGFSESVASGFNDLNSGESIAMVTGLLLDQDASDQFQEVLSAPDLILNTFLSNMGGTYVQVEPGQLAGVEEVGDQATAVTGTVNMQGTSVRSDTLLLKRGNIGVWMFTIYLNGSTPTAPIVDLSKVVDARIVDLLGQE